MKYHFSLVIAIFLFFTGCSKQSSTATQSLNETNTQAQNTQNNDSFQDDHEPENGVYEPEQQSSFWGKSEFTQIDLVDLVNQVKENPALAELLKFKTQGRVVTIATDTDANGQRVAVIRLEHPQYNPYKGQYDSAGAFYCLFTLEDAAQLRNKQALEFTGSILDIGERTSYFLGQYPFQSKEILADCNDLKLLDG